MKVLMTADTVGGVWTYALELCRALRPFGVEVVLATMGAAVSDEQRAGATACGNVSLRESRFALEWMPDPWEDVARAGEWLLELEAEVRPDVVHLNGYAHGHLPWRAPVVMVAHSDVLSWWRAVKGQDAPPEWDRYRAEVGRGLLAADLLVAPTQAVLDGMPPHFALPQSTRVIPNGRDATGWGPKRKEPFIFSAGRLWDEAKNIALLDEVAPNLPWPIYVAGDDRSPTGERVAPRHLKMLGRLSESELRDWMGRASIYALPAKYEPFGLSALEAALCGCCLVLGDIASLKEIWSHHWPCCAAPAEADAWRRALTSVIEAPRLRETWAQNARAAALEYTPERMAKQYAASYREVLKRHRTRQKHEAKTTSR